MAEKPPTRAGYDSGHTDLVLATCLHVATKLGDLMDELVVVGGLVPTLLIDQNALPTDVPRHVGTLDLDVGLSVALLHEGRYQTIGERLRSADFKPHENAAGNQTRQRWLHNPGKITLDFLIAPTLESDRPGSLRNLEPDFAAIIAPGLQLAFRDR